MSVDTAGVQVMCNYYDARVGLDSKKLKSLLSNNVKLLYSLDGQKVEVRGRDEVMKIYNEIFEKTTKVVSGNIKLTPDGKTPSLAAKYIEIKRKTGDEKDGFDAELLDSTKLCIVSRPQGKWKIGEIDCTITHKYGLFAS